MVSRPSSENSFQQIEKRAEGMKRIPVLLGREKVQWAVEGMDLVVIAETRLVLRVRDTMRQELEESAKGIRYLPCFYMEADSLPTLGVGTHLYGGGWQVHTSARLNVEMLLSLVTEALFMPWTQVAPTANQGLLDIVESKPGHDSRLACRMAC